MSILDRARSFFRSDSGPGPRQLPGPRGDSWQNLYTSIGMEGKDARVSTRYGGRAVISDKELVSLYERNWIAERVIDVVVEETTKNWFELIQEQEKGKDGKEQDKTPSELQSYLQRLDAKAKVQEAFRWARLLGGAVILIGAEDGAADLRMPLNESGIKTIKYLQVYDRRYAQAGNEYEDDPESPDFGLPRFYELRSPNGGSSRSVHRSRIVRFEGKPVDVERRRERMSWGLSELERVYEPARDYGTTMAATAVAAASFSQGVLSVEDLANLLSSGDTESILNRLHAFKLGLSMANVALVDAKHEKYDRIGQQVTGLSDIIDRQQMDVAGSTTFPVSVLFGNMAGKLSGAQEDSSRWEARMQGVQETKLDKPLQRMCRLILLAKDGPTAGKEPKGWKLKWHPIVPSDPDKELDRRKKQAEVDHLYYQDNVLQPSEIRKSRFAGQEYSHETSLDSEITTAQEEADRAEAENAKGGPPAPPEPGGPQPQPPGPTPGPQPPQPPGRPEPAPAGRAPQPPANPRPGR